MPKKTKRAKIHADARRNLIPSPLTAPQKTDHPQEMKPASADHSLYTFQKSHPAPKSPARIQEDDHEFQSIKRDLARTVILASLAFVAEFILYLKFGT